MTTCGCNKVICDCATPDGWPEHARPIVPVTRFAPQRDPQLWELRGGPILHVEEYVCADPSCECAQVFLELRAGNPQAERSAVFYATVDLSTWSLRLAAPGDWPVSDERKTIWLLQLSQQLLDCGFLELDALYSRVQTASMYLYWQYGDWSRLNTSTLKAWGRFFPAEGTWSTHVGEKDVAATDFYCVAPCVAQTANILVCEDPFGDHTELGWLRLDTNTGRCHREPVRGRARRLQRAQKRILEAGPPLHELADRAHFMHQLAGTIVRARRMARA